MVCCLPVLAHAGQIERVDVTSRDGLYRVTVVARIAATPRRLIDLLTDYGNLHAINPSVRQSRVLESLSERQHRVETLIELCVLFFCSEFRQVQDMRYSPPGLLSAQVLPEHSDFRSGWARWQFSDGGDATQLHFESELAPKFFIPPIVGPLIIRHMMKREALATIDGLERLAR